MVLSHSLSQIVTLFTLISTGSANFNLGNLHVDTVSHSLVLILPSSLTALIEPRIQGILPTITRNYAEILAWKNNVSQLKEAPRVKASGNTTKLSTKLLPEPTEIPRARNMQPPPRKPLVVVPLSFLQTPQTRDFSPIFVGQKVLRLL